MQVKRLADEKHKSIGILQSSEETLKQKISDLSARRKTLLAELKQVEEALTQAQQEESQSCLRGSKLSNKNITSKPTKHYR